MGHAVPNTPQWISIQMTNFQFTDASGIATFTKGTALDGTNQYIPVKFRCVVGDNQEGFYTSSPLTTLPYKFYSSTQFVLDESYSRQIAPNQVFAIPPKVTVTIINVNILEYQLTAQIKEFDGKAPNNPELFTAQYMSGFTCNIKTTPPPS
jgi:hypothetical protein